MHLITGNSVSDIFLQACQRVLSQGQTVQPRGLETKELYPVHIQLNDPRQRYVWVEGRVLNPAFAVAELLYILSGSNADWIFQYNQRLKTFADDGILKAAYGPRIRRWNKNLDQLQYAQNMLAQDPASRRAVIQIWDPTGDTGRHKDIACTLNLRFLIRDGQLHLFSTMRSQDIWWGLPYDLFNLSFLLELMSGWLAVPMGRLYHTVDSFHLYEQFYLAAAQVAAATQPLSCEVADYQLAWPELETTLAQILAFEPTAADDTLPPAGLPEAYQAFAYLLASYRAWKRGDKSWAWDLSAHCGAWGTPALRAWYHHLNDPTAKAPHGLG